jgi:hypothetical protein
MAALGTARIGTARVDTTNQPVKVGLEETARCVDLMSVESVGAESLDSAEAPEKFCPDISRIVDRSCCMKYSNLKRLLIGFIVLYLGVALISGFRFRHREVFPIFSWSLFSQVQSSRSDFAVLITQIGNRTFEPPIELKNADQWFPRGGHIRSYITIQNMGNAFLRRDRRTLEISRRILESNYMNGPAEPVKYLLISRRYDPIERWHDGRYQQRNLATFERDGA